MSSTATNQGEGARADCLLAVLVLLALILGVFVNRFGMPRLTIKAGRGAVALMWPTAIHVVALSVVTTGGRWIGTSSSRAPSSMKCHGGSTCVPVCPDMCSTARLQASPLAMGGRSP